MTTILPRRGTEADWTAANPVLAMGELGYETDTTRWKRGDGTTAWNALAYYQPSWSDVTSKPAVIAAGADQAAARVAIGLGPVLVIVAGSGIDPTGEVDSASAIQALIDNAPDGAVVRFPAGVYNTDSSALTIVDKTLTLDMAAATFTRSISGIVIDASATAGDIHNVTSVTSTTVTEDTVRPAVTISFADAGLNTGWVRGDIIKLISDDEIPGANPGDTVNKRRTGQFFTVESASAGTVTVYGSMYDPMTTNIRAYRLKSEHRVRLVGGTFDAVGGGSGVIRCTNLVGASVSNPTITTQGGAGVVVRGCVNTAATPEVRYAPNNPGSLILGYGVNDVSSSYGVFNIRSLRSRHAYTTNTNAIPSGSTDVWLYGRTFGSVVSGISRDSASSAWDTHAEGAEIIFDNIAAFGAWALIGLRGRKHKVRNAFGRDLDRLIYIFSHDGQYAESWGHEIDGVIGDNVSTASVGAITVSLNSITGTRETRLSRIRNVVINNNAAQVIYATNCSLEIHNISAAPGTMVPDYIGFLYPNNSVINGSGFKVDMRSNTTGTGLSLVSLSSGDLSEVRLSGINEFLFSTAQASRVAALIRRNDAQELIQISGLELDAAAPARVTGTAPDNNLFSASSYLEWKVRTNSGSGDTAEVMKLSDAALESDSWLTSLSQTRSSLIALSAHITVNRTLAALPPGRFSGQSLVISRSGTGASVSLTIQNSDPKRTRTASGTDFLLSRNSSIMFMWNGTFWVQTAPPIASPSGTAPLDFGSVSAQSSADLTITVTGAALGDSVALGVPTASVTAGVMFTAWVSAANTVTVRAHNYSAAAADPASGSFKATIVR